MPAMIFGVISVYRSAAKLTTKIVETTRSQNVEDGDRPAPIKSIQAY
jgi:hypothetical protein